MGMMMIWKAVDAAWVLFSLIEAELDHYLIADPPPFFRGFIWLVLVLVWPVSIANLYGAITRRRRWVATTSLMGGVCWLTYLSAMYGEMLGSGRATPKLLRFYVPYAVFAVTLILRGIMFSCSAELPAGTTTARLVEASAQKKRA